MDYWNDTMKLVLPKCPARYRVPVFALIRMHKQACHAAECKNPQLIVGGLCAQEWIRTITSLRTLRPEHSASTNFATWALLKLYYWPNRPKLHSGLQI